MKPIQFPSLEKFDLAVRLFANIWKRNNRLDPDLELDIKCTDNLSYYTAVFSYNLSLAHGSMGPEGSFKEVERGERPLIFSIMEDDKRLEELVNETLDEISLIRVAA